MLSFYLVYVKRILYGTCNLVYYLIKILNKSSHYCFSFLIYIFFEGIINILDLFISRSFIKIQHTCKLHTTNKALTVLFYFLKQIIANRTVSYWVVQTFVNIEIAWKPDYTTHNLFLRCNVKKTSRRITRWQVNDSKGSTQ